MLFLSTKQKLFFQALQKVAVLGFDNQFGRIWKIEIYFLS